MLTHFLGSKRTAFYLGDALRDLLVLGSAFGSPFQIEGAVFQRGLGIPFLVGDVEETIINGVRHLGDGILKGLVVPLGIIKLAIFQIRNGAIHQDDQALGIQAVGVIEQFNGSVIFLIQDF